MRTTCIIPFLIFTGSLTLFALGRPPGGPPDQLARALDKNHDFQLSADEINNAPTALLLLDGNGDMVLSAEEIKGQGRGNDRRGGQGDNQRGPQGGPQQGPPHGGNDGQDGGHGGPPQGGPDGDQGGGQQRPSPLMSSLDTDGSGDLSKAEIDAAPASLAKLDTNGDGAVSHEEFGPGDRRGGGHGGGPQGGQGGGHQRGPQNGERPGPPRGGDEGESVYDDYYFRDE